MRSILFLFLLPFFAAPAFAQNADIVIGRWKNSTGDVQLEITQKGPKYFGAIAWLKKPLEADGSPNVDDMNPEKTLRHRPLQGLEILTDLSFKGNGAYAGGSIYNPKSGKTYSCKLEVKGDKMTMRGYLGFSLLGKTELWDRVTPGADKR